MSTMYNQPTHMIPHGASRKPCYQATASSSRYLIGTVAVLDRHCPVDAYEEGRYAQLPGVVEMPRCCNTYAPPPLDRDLEFSTANRTEAPKLRHDDNVIIAREFSEICRVLMVMTRSVAFY